VREATDLPILLQGDDSPGALQHRFASDARTCLFGTRSFWQGVDTPGSACQLVVIDRIPFGHLDDPLSKARLAAAADSGRNGFLEVTLPPAAVLLAQGAGRLIRSTGDRGVVAVLDPRLATAGYANVLLDSLPGFYRARSKKAVLASLRAIDASAPPVLPVGPPPSERRRTG
jgi:ATP-dependent DNA helicase DinG